MPNDSKPTPKPDDEIHVEPAPLASFDELLRDRSELQALKARQADDCARRLERLPPTVRARLPRGAGLAETEAFLTGIEVALGSSPRSPGTPGLNPPSGLGPPSDLVYETDVTALPAREREAFFRSAKFREAVASGKFIRRDLEGAYRNR